MPPTTNKTKGEGTPVLLHGAQCEHSTTLVSYAYDAVVNLAEVFNLTGKPLRYR